VRPRAIEIRPEPSGSDTASAWIEEFVAWAKATYNGNRYASHWLEKRI
jgi:hypothetical protein